MTKRILPDALLAAYVKLGATPRQGWGYSKAENVGSGTGVYAVAVLDHPTGVPRYYSFLEANGFAHDYLAGFHDGFDGFNSNRRYSEGGVYPGGQPTADYKLGWDDGKAGWDAVKHLAREGDAK